MDDKPLILSSVACIVSPDGGRRIVITEWFRMLNHLGPGERLFVVPGLLVDEATHYETISDEDGTRARHVDWIAAAEAFALARMQQNPEKIRLAVVSSLYRTNQARAVGRAALTVNAPWRMAA